MKNVSFSVFAVLFAVYGADCFAYFSEKSSRRVMAPPLVTITRMQQVTNRAKIIKIEPQELKKSPEVLVKESIWDGRLFADVVKGVKKQNPSKNEQKLEKKSKKQMKKSSKYKLKKKSKEKLEEFLLPNPNYKKAFHDDWRAKQSDENKFNNKKLSAKEGVNKRSQSAHRGNLYRSR